MIVSGRTIKHTETLRSIRSLKWELHRRLWSFRNQEERSSVDCYTRTHRRTCTSGKHLDRSHNSSGTGRYDWELTWVFQGVYYFHSFPIHLTEPDGSTFAPVPGLVTVVGGAVQRLPVCLSLAPWFWKIRAEKGGRVRKKQIIGSSRVDIYSGGVDSA